MRLVQVKQNLLSLVPDINECTSAVDKHDCHLNADCTNFPGSFNCSCKIGFEGDGKSCTGVKMKENLRSKKLG